MTEQIRVTKGNGNEARTIHRSSLRPSAADTIFCFSHLRWDFVFQRPGHLLSLAAREFRVLYIEEPILMPPGDAAQTGNKPWLDWTRLPSGVERLVPHIPQGTDALTQQQMLKTMASDIEARASRGLSIGWYYTPMALSFSEHLEFDVCVYDCMDELAAFKGAPQNLKSEEERLLERADIVFTGGKSLYDAKCERHPNVHLFPSSVDRSHFEPARRAESRAPADIAGIPHPRIGYFGVIDERLDYDLIARLADDNAEWQFVMIGPTAKIDPKDLPQRPNIHWLGGKLYADLPRYLAAFDVGFMPFAINEATRFISPTKTPEFLAAGLPVVSTPIADVVRTYGPTGLVETASGAHAITAALRRALDCKATPSRYHAWLARADHVLSAMSWDKTWQAMAARIRDELVEQPTLQPSTRDLLGTASNA